MLFLFSTPDYIISLKIGLVVLAIYFIYKVVQGYREKPKKN